MLPVHMLLRTMAHPYTPLPLRLHQSSLRRRIRHLSRSRHTPIDRPIQPLHNYSHHTIRSYPVILRPKARRRHPHHHIYQQLLSLRRLHRLITIARLHPGLPQWT